MGTIKTAKLQKNWWITYKKKFNITYEILESKTIEIKNNYCHISSPVSPLQSPKSLLFSAPLAVGSDPLFKLKLNEWYCCGMANCLHSWIKPFRFLDKIGSSYLYFLGMIKPLLRVMNVLFFAEKNPTWFADGLV